MNYIELLADLFGMTIEEVKDMMLESLLLEES